MGATSTISDIISEKFTGNASTRSSNITFSQISEITYLHLVNLCKTLSVHLQDPIHMQLLTYYSAAN